MMSIVSEIMFPLFVLLILSVSIVRKKDTISAFTRGAKNGFSAICSITPNILAVMVASSVFRESGALAFLLKYLTPVFRLIRIPGGITELILLRPISGSGAMVLLSQIFERFGADSYEGLLASVICASTETTLYTVMVYFGVTGVKKTKLPLMIGLLTDCIVIILAVIVVNLLFPVT
ncbi:MAG: spore maturation protein [Clostridia bacterium]|nr:spore maturation protein [Clostridia bacterium]